MWYWFITSLLICQRTLQCRARVQLSILSIWWLSFLSSHYLLSNGYWKQLSYIWKVYMLFIVDVMITIKEAASDKVKVKRRYIEIDLYAIRRPHTLLFPLNYTNAFFRAFPFELRTLKCVHYWKAIIVSCTLYIAPLYKSRR